MAWARLCDQANGNGKLIALSNGAYRLWISALVYCQRNLTDGFVPEHAVSTFGVRAKSPRELRSFTEELCRVSVPGKAPLWHPVAGGYQVHDYLDWNECKETVEANREITKRRVALFRDPALRAEIRARDGHRCRYCGIAVKWSDRKGPDGGTYDHVDPKGPNTIDNLVVACRSCNSRKAARTPEQAGMLLQPVLDLSTSRSRSDLNRFQPSNNEKSRLVPAPTTTVEDQDQEDQRRSRAALRVLEPDDAPQVLTKLAHTVLDAVDAGVLPVEELTEELKLQAARANLRYDGDRVRKALDSAQVQRERARSFA